MVAQPSPLGFPFAPVGNPFELYFTSMDAFSQALDPWKAPAKSVARCQLEALGFMSRRAQAYMNITSDLARCRSPQDLANAQMQFWRTAFEQYTETGRRMVEAWQPMMSAARQAPRHERDYITFPANGAGDARIATRDVRRRVA